MSRGNPEFGRLPEIRAKVVRRMNDPVERERLLAIRRGFVLPKHLESDYAFLRRSKELTAREAGEVLGLVEPRRRVTVQ